MVRFGGVRYGEVRLGMETTKNKKD